MPSNYKLNTVVVNGAPRELSIQEMTCLRYSAQDRISEEYWITELEKAVWGSLLNNTSPR